MSGQETFQRTLLSQPRLKPYLEAAGDDAGKAWSLYLWANELAGALHAQISLIEVAIRNSIDRELQVWNSSFQGAADWTLENQAKEPLYGLLNAQLREARKNAVRASEKRSASHPRHAAPITHNDVIAQLMFASWVKLLVPLSDQETPDRQQALWADALKAAFPGANQQDTGRSKVGNQLDSIRRLRNRVAHHDNILNVSVKDRLNEMLSLVHKVNPAYPGLVMGRSRVRSIANQDPRREWKS